MTNIIYNQFLQRFMGQEIDLVSEEYCIALFTDRYTPTTGGSDTYFALSMAGMECADGNDLYSDNPYKGYKKGGKEVHFTKLADTPYTSNFSAGKIQWDNISLSGDNSAYYAIIYKKNDGLLVACFPFEVPVACEDDTLILNWENTITLAISSSAGMSIDGELSKVSSNAVQNKTITDRIEKIYTGIEKFGIRLNGEGPDDDDWSDDENVDALDRIDESAIDHMFED